MKEYNLTRFLSAQEAAVDGYSQALAEIRSGRKVHHWIWYIFPQLHGLGKSSNSVFYGMRGPGEAKAYLLHPVLKSRLLEISKALLELETNDPRAVMGTPDNLKLRSCMTLFEAVAEDSTVFSQVLEKYYHGRRDRETLRMLESQSQQN